MPIDCAATSLPRSARNVRPIVPRRMCTTARPTMTSTMTTRTRYALSSAKSHGPITGRGTRVPVNVEPPTHESLTITASKKKANAKVAIATQMPLSRRIGSESTAPTAAAMHAPTRAATITDRS